VKGVNMWWFIGLCVFIGILKIFQMMRICKLGFHDKLRIDGIGQGFNCNEYILKEMKEHSIFNGSDIYSATIFREIYGYGIGRHGANPKLKYDYVCIKCGKCYHVIKKEKETIKIYVYSQSEDLRKTDIRKKMAQDLYKEKCK
jgi:hypothetical protein